MKLYDFGASFLAGIVLIGTLTAIFASGAHEPAVDAVKAEVQIEQNADTGLTDVTIPSIDKEFSLCIQPLDYSKLND